MAMKSHRVITVERELGLEIHPQYAAFLDKYGVYCTEGVEVYGYSEAFTDLNGLPCVIFTTKDWKEMYHLDPSDRLIADTEDSDYVAVLDNETGEILEVNFDGDRTVVAPSFDAWFAMVRERDYI